MSELLDDIMSKTYKGLDTDFASGFSGIGWGLEYLIQNNFVKGNSANISEELDLKIMEKDPIRIVDTSLKSGLEGLLHYVLANLCVLSIENGASPDYGLIIHEITHIGQLMGTNTGSASNAS